MRKIIHIDMDCFYAAIEMRDNPALKDRAVAVGGSADRRGVICTCNYPAREYGVRSAMATAHAMRLCPDLLLLPVDMPKYKAVAASIRTIFYQYTNKVEPISLDEAYLDVTDCLQYQGSATWIARAIRAQIFREQQLTASAGVAPNKFLAKIGSDWKKPNGQFVIPPAAIADFIVDLPIDKIPGVGQVTAKKINRLNIHTCQDLQLWPSEQLQEKFSAFGLKLFDYCRGIDKREVNPNRMRKSVSVEATFPADIKQLAQCLQKIAALFIQLQQRLENYAERAVKNQFVKIKFNNFAVTTVTAITNEPKLNLFEQLCATAYLRQQLPVRLLGVGVSFYDENISVEKKQLDLDV
jgi:DNA polymerase-4